MPWRIIDKEVRRAIADARKLIEQVLKADGNEAGRSAHARGLDRFGAGEVS